MSMSHVHLLLNHFPTVGTVIALGLFLLALVWKHDDLKKVSLGIFPGHRPPVYSWVHDGLRRSSRNRGPSRRL